MSVMAKYINNEEFIEIGTWFFYVIFMIIKLISPYTMTWDISENYISYQIV